MKFRTHSGVFFIDLSGQVMDQSQHYTASQSRRPRFESHSWLISINRKI